MLATARGAGDGTRLRVYRPAPRPGDPGEVYVISMLGGARQPGSYDDWDLSPDEKLQPGKPELDTGHPIAGPIATPSEVAAESQPSAWARRAGAIFRHPHQGHPAPAARKA